MEKRKSTASKHATIKQNTDGMDPSYSHIIEHRRKRFYDELKWSDAFVKSLEEKKLIERIHVVSIEHEPTPANKGFILITQLIEHGKDGDFDIFVDCLQESGNKHLADQLRYDVKHMEYYDPVTKHIKIGSDSQYLESIGTVLLKDFMTTSDENIRKAIGDQITAKFYKLATHLRREEKGRKLFCDELCNLLDYKMKPDHRISKLDLNEEDGFLVLEEMIADQNVKLLSKVRSLIKDLRGEGKRLESKVSSFQDMVKQAEFIPDCSKHVCNKRDLETLKDVIADQDKQIVLLKYETKKSQANISFTKVEYDQLLHLAAKTVPNFKIDENHRDFNQVLQTFNEQIMTHSHQIDKLKFKLTQADSVIEEYENERKKTTHILGADNSQRPLYEIVDEGLKRMVTGTFTDREDEVNYLNNLLQDSIKTQSEMKKRIEQLEGNVIHAEEAAKQHHNRRPGERRSIPHPPRNRANSMKTERRPSKPPSESAPSKHKTLISQHSGTRVDKPHTSHHRSSGASFDEHSKTNPSSTSLAKVWH